MKGMLQIALSTAIQAVHANVFNKHVTVVFKADLDTVTPILGKEVEVTLVSEHVDDKGQAVRVKYDEWLMEMANKEPHITISCAEGTKPMYSNELIKNEGVPIDGTITGVLKFKEF